jgi:hypothetical protein
MFIHTSSPPPLGSAQAFLDCGCIATPALGSAHALPAGLPIGWPGGIGIAMGLRFESTPSA